MYAITRTHSVRQLIALMRLEPGAAVDVSQVNQGCRAIERLILMMAGGYT